VDTLDQLVVLVFKFSMVDGAQLALALLPVVVVLKPVPAHALLLLMVVLLARARLHSLATPMRALFHVLPALIPSLAPTFQARPHAHHVLPTPTLQVLATLYARRAH